MLFKTRNVVAIAKGGPARLIRLNCDIMSRNFFVLRLGFGAESWHARYQTKRAHLIS